MTESSLPFTNEEMLQLVAERRWDELLIGLAVIISRHPGVVGNFTPQQTETAYQLLLLLTARDVVH